jgi:hypothetical protein
MQSYSDQRGYFENSLAESITKRKSFRSGLSIHDISKPGEMREIAFLEMPGLGVNRLSWMGGRYAYVSAHFDGFTDHCLCIVDLQEITKPVIVSKWWLPGMNRAAGEVSNTPKGKRYALHHMIVAGKLGYGAGATAASPSTMSRMLPSRNSCRTSTGRRHFPAARTRRCRCRGATSRWWRMRRTRRSAPKGCSRSSCSMCGYRKIP